MTRSKTGIPNVVRKGFKYWFQIKVPKDILNTIGKSNWQTNLQTNDLRVAKQRAEVAAREAREVFAKARQLDPIEAEGVQWREGQVISSGEPNDDLKYILMTDRAEELDKDYGLEDAKRFVTIASGENFNVHVDLWCKEVPVAHRTERIRKSAVNRFIKYSPSVTLGNINRSLVGKYSSHLLNEGLDPVTINNQLQHLGSYFKFCRRKGLVNSQNPL